MNPVRRTHLAQNTHFAADLLNTVGNLLVPYKAEN